MPVDSKHPEYAQSLDKWQRYRLVIEGEDAVKSAGVRFLPRLGGQDLADYEAYKKRALFYGATSRIVQALQGAVFRKDAILRPDDLPQTFQRQSATGQDFSEFSRKVLYEVLVTGRYGIFVDTEETAGSGAYLTGYEAESIVNWRSRFHKGRHHLDRVTLKEENQISTQDPFEMALTTSYRVLSLDKEGLYQVELWQEGEAGEFYPSKTYQPKFLGKRIDFIPFCFVGPIDSSPKVQKSPIADVVSVNLSHYRSSADLEHGRHFTALPTAWVSGFDPEQILTIGSQTAWISEKADARAGYLEFSGKGLAALENALKEKQDLMAILGARLLEEPRRAVESADTHRIRQASEHSVLVSIARSVSISMSRAIGWLADFTGIQQEISFELNHDLASGPMQAVDLLAMMKAWQAGAMSWDSLMHNLKKGELLPPNRSADEEKRLVQEGPKPPLELRL